MLTFTWPIRSGVEKCHTTESLSLFFFLSILVGLIVIDYLAFHRVVNERKCLRYQLGFSILSLLEAG